MILRAWTSDGRWSHKGATWNFNDIVVEPEPVQSPRPPVWVGAGSEPSITRAADRGFNVLLDQIGQL